MNIATVIFGLIIGAFIGASGGSALLGAAAGAAIAFLLGRLNRLENQTRELTASLRALRHGREVPPTTAPEPEPVPRARPIDEPASAREHEIAVRVRAETPVPESEFETGPEKSAARPGATSWAGPTKRQPSTGPSLLEQFLGFAKGWITSGNVPVKVGVIVSFIGVSFLLKYAIDRELLAIPLEFRLLGVALAGVALVVTGWRLRNKARTYALSLQGGGAGILFLTIFSALRLWQLLPASLAFVLLILLTLCTGALAVLQNSRALAILGIVGGFLAPVLTSTGQGSHVVLFSYYLVLNGAILGIAWFRAWRELNLVGFVFTFLISGFWGYQYFKPALFGSTEPFLLLYFLLYQAIAILYALRQAPERLGVVDGTLVFGTPVIVFGLQAELLRGSEYGLAISAAAVAVFYALIATWLYRKKGGYLKLMTESYMALAVAFATIAIPLALDARWTSAAWALEGAALVWVGVRQGRQLANLAGAALIFLGGFALIDHGWRHDSGLPILNGNVLGGLMISVSALFASRRLGKFESPKFAFIYPPVAVGLFAWGALWWGVTGWIECSDRLALENRVLYFLLFAAISTAAATGLGRYRSWRLMQLSGFVLLPIMAALAIEGFMDEGHWLRGAGWLAWPVAFAIQAMVLKEADKRGEILAGAWHVATLLLLSFMLALEARWRVSLIASGAWAFAAATSVTGIVAMLTWRFRSNPPWPIPAHASAYLATSLVLVAGQVIGLSWFSVTHPGDPDPLPYIPVFNPSGLAMLVAMLTAFLSLQVNRRALDGWKNSDVSPYIRAYRMLLAAAFFIMTTAALVRGVHHFAAVPWAADTLFESVVVQTALSIYWGLLGFAGMIYGARRAHRPVWLIGAGFMALVVIKLFLVDLGKTGTVERIISFIGIGALLLIVGYFAPAPPRQTMASAGEDEQEAGRHEDS